jgi:hypothetical protein
MIELRTPATRLVLVGIVVALARVCENIKKREVLG